MSAEKHTDDDKIQSAGRKANAAQPLNAAPDNAGAERYPSTKKDDSIDAANPQPPQGAGDGHPAPADRR